MNSWKSILFPSLAVLVCYLGFTQGWFSHSAAFGFSFPFFLALMAFCYFEHAVLFRDKWKEPQAGRGTTPPGQSLIAGSIFLLLAIASMAYCFHH